MKNESKSDVKSQQGKEYEQKAIQATGQTMTNIMRACSSYMKGKNLLDFNYFVRINSNGDTVNSIVHPSNTLTSCFNGLMVNTKYPSHKFDTFVLNIDMKITP